MISKTFLIVSTRNLGISVKIFKQQSSLVIQVADEILTASIGIGNNDAEVFQ
jgi:hypothetical protein